jgi:hypothetical protein
MLRIFKYVFFLFLLANISFAKADPVMYKVEKGTLKFNLPASISPETKLSANADLPCDDELLYDGDGNDNDDDKDSDGLTKKIQCYNLYSSQFISATLTNTYHQFFIQYNLSQTYSRTCDHLAQLSNFRI